MRPLEIATGARSWSTHEPQELSPRSWEQLARNEIPLIVLRGVATHAECATLVARAASIGFAQYENVQPPIDRIGATVFEHNNTSMQSYFAEANRVRALQNEIFSKSFSPLERFTSRMLSALGRPVELASDPQHGNYYAGLVRRIENSTLLHIDYAPAEAPTWSIASVTSQLAWNLYVELSDIGAGVTHVYNRPWQPADEAMKVPNTYGYEHALVAGAERITFRPTLGDVYIFNTRNFHEVEASLGRRTTVTSAIGIEPEGDIVLWS